MNAYAQKEQKASSEKDKTGIPAQMKAKFERSSGFSFDDVRVHYNSEKPAQLHAHAYTQGSDVFVAPGQEKHLPHELGHVVQQKSNAVKPTGEIGGMPLNDDESMESGADKLAEEAESSEDSSEKPLQAKAKDGGVVQRAEASVGSYNYYAGEVSGVSNAISTVFGGLGMIGALGSFIYSKNNTRKHKYIDEVDKYADAACEAREEQKAAIEQYKTIEDEKERAQARAEAIKQKDKANRNFKTALQKATEMELGSHYIKNKINTVSCGALFKPADITENNFTQTIKDKNVVNALTRAKEAKDEANNAENNVYMPVIAPPPPPPPPQQVANHPQNQVQNQRQNRRQNPRQNHRQNHRQNQLNQRGRRGNRH